MELLGFIQDEHRFELGDQDSSGEYTIDGSVSSTVTFAANTLCVCSQQHRRTVKRSTVVHILVDDILFISGIQIKIELDKQSDSRHD